MNVLSRRSIVRSGSVLLALPFAGPLLPAYGAEQANSQTAPPTGAVKLSSNASTAVSLDFVNFVKDQSAKVTAANHQGKNPDYASLGDQFHMLGKHMSLAGADKLVKKHCKNLLKTGAVPTVDSQAVAHAVSCVQTYAPSFSPKDLLGSSSLPSTTQEWGVHLKKLKKKGLVKYCHQAARQLNAMDSAAHNQAMGLSSSGPVGSYKPAGYVPLDASRAAHLVEICSLSQKEKFCVCIGAIVAVGLIVLAVVVAACGATALAACFGGGTLAYVYIAGFGLLSAGALAACTAFLASYHQSSRPSSSVLAI